MVNQTVLSLIFATPISIRSGTFPSFMFARKSEILDHYLSAEAHIYMMSYDAISWGGGAYV